MQLGTIFRMRYGDINLNTEIWVLFSLFSGLAVFAAIYFTCVSFGRKIVVLDPGEYVVRNEKGWVTSVDENHKTYMSVAKLP